DVERPVANMQPISLVDRLIHLAAGHGKMNSLGVDPGVGENLVALFESLDTAGMSRDRALEDLAGAGQPLGVVHISMRGHDQLASREAESICRVSSRTSVSSSRKP